MSGNRLEKVSVPVNIYAKSYGDLLNIKEIKQKEPMIKDNYKLILLLKLVAVAVFHFAASS